MISFRSGVVMAPRPNHLMYTGADILPSALAVKDGAGVVPQRAAGDAGDGAVQSSAVAPGRCR